MKTRTFFTVLFGIIGPLVCIFLDPIVFRFDLADPPLGFSSPYLGDYQPFAYAAIALSCALLIVHLAGISFPPALHVAVAGGLLASAVFALALGVVLLPYSIVGIFILIGLLGFTPFFTSWMYARAGLAEFRGAQGVPRRPLLALAGALTFFTIASGFHLAVHHSLTQALDALNSPSAESRTTSITTIRRWDYLFGHQRLIAAHRQSRSEAHRRALADAYQTLTNRDLEADLQRAND